MKKQHYFEIGAVSLAAILLEVAYTRIFSFKIFYYFTYVVIGVGLMGLGAGGVLVALSRRVREARPEWLIPSVAFGGGASVAAGYWVIAPLELNVSVLGAMPGEIEKLVWACVLVVLPFLSVGTIVSSVLAHGRHAVRRLYATDLVAAAVGCVLSIPLLNALDPPRTVLLSGAILAAAGLRLALSNRWLLGAGLVTTLIALLPVAGIVEPPDPIVDEGKLFEELRRGGYHRLAKWNPVFRIDVFDHPFYSGELFFVYHDGLPGSGLRRFDGDFSAHDRMRKDPRAWPFTVLPAKPEVLIVGSAGGHEVLASLYFGARHVTGVELNPATLSLLTDHFADTTGRLPERSDVDFINGDARWFLKQTDEKYDIIWYVAPDSYAAMNAATSGAFVLSESYLYTVEMLKETLQHLRPGGVVCAQFGDMDYERRPNRTARFVTTARAALSALGVRDVRPHFLIGGAPGFPPQQDAVILVSPTPFTDEQLQQFRDYAPAIEKGRLIYSPDQAADASPVNQVIALSDTELENWYRTYPYQIDPVYDDSPFFWHFASFERALSTPDETELQGGAIDYEVAIGEKFMVLLLAVVSGLAALLLFSPFVVIRKKWAALPYKGRVAAYFGALGLGFLFVEIALIQMLTLFVGYPTRSLTITLFAILLSSGVGSFASERFARDRKKALPRLVAVLAGLLLAYHFGLPVLIDAFGGAVLPVRAALTVLLIAPLGLCLGAFLPLGVSVVTGFGVHEREYVAWSWAVNGFFSVVASVLATIVAMATGYHWVLAIAGFIYVGGAAALWSIPEGSR